MPYGYYHKTLNYANVNRNSCTNPFPDRTIKTSFGKVDAPKYACACI